MTEELPAKEERILQKFAHDEIYGKTKEKFDERRLKSVGGREPQLRTRLERPPC